MFYFQECANLSNNNGNMENSKQETKKDVKSSQVSCNVDSGSSGLMKDDNTDTTFDSCIVNMVF